MLSNKKLLLIVAELFIRGIKSIAFITQYYFTVPKKVRLNSTHCFTTKIPDKRER